VHRDSFVPLSSQSTSFFSIRQIDNDESLIDQSLKNNLSYYYEKEHKSMGARTLKIPEEIINALRVPPDDVEAELYKELALALYQRGMLSSGKASALSGLTRQQFEDLLGQRKIKRHYGEAELEEDLKYAGCSQ
jgi:predicted HTH domain antitoxin